MESAVRSPWIKSAITTGRARNDALLASQDSQNSRQPTGIGRQNPAAGNGIFGCRDGRLKIGLRDRKGHRRPKEWNDTGRKSPQKRPIGSQRRDLRFRRTGWWCAQSYTNRSPCYLTNIRVIFENNSEPAAESVKKACSTGISRIS